MPRRAMRGEFANPDVLLLPGMYVRVQTRQVRTGTMSGSDWHIVEGLAAGDRVIVGGVNAAVPGQKVRVAPAPQAKVAAVPGGDADAVR